MKKKIVALLISAVMVLGTLAGCGSSASTENAPAESAAAEEPAEEAEASAEEAPAEEAAATEVTGPKEIKVGWPYEPETLDSAQASADAAYMLIHMIGEPLLRNVDGEAQPGIAETYDVNEDMTEYTFHLRESVYSDGTPVTANDYYYGIMRVLDPAVASPNSYQIYFIDGAEAYNMGEAEADTVGVEVIDDYTLKITCNATTYPLSFTQKEFYAANQAFVESCEGYGSEAEKALTNGPFNVTEWVHDGSVVLEKNANYWNADAVKMDKITLVLNAANVETGVDMMLAGELDSSSFTSMNQVNTLVDTGNYNYNSNYTGYQFLHINHAGKTEDTGKWLSNTNFRKALSAAIDREALVQAVYTTDTASNRWSTPSDKGVDGMFVEEFPYEAWSTTADVEAAKEYLAAAMEELGASDVSEIPVFTFLCFDSQKNMDALNAVGAMWSSNLGIQTTIDAQPITSMLDKAYSGDFDFWKGGIAPGYVDWLVEPMSEYLSGQGAPYNCNFTELDDLYNVAATATNWADRKAAMFEIEKYWCDNVVDLHLTWSTSNYVTEKNISGVLYGIGYADYTYADITE